LPTFNIYPLDDFENNEYLNSLQSTKDVMSESALDVVDSVHLDLAEVSDELPERFQQLLKENEQIRGVWKGTKPIFKSRSEYDMSMASRLCRLEFSTEEVYSILLQMASGRGKQGRKDYFERTIGKAQKGKQRREAPPNMNVRHEEYQEIADEIYEIRQKRYQGDLRRPFEIHSEVAKIMIRDLRSRGGFLNDGLLGYFFLEKERKLVKIHPDEMECRLLLGRYGINATEALFKYLLEALRVETLENGTQTEVHQFCYFDQRMFRIYLFNHDSEIYRISPDEVDLVPNGTDGVLFVADSKTQPFRVVEVDSSSNSLETALFLKVNYCEGFLTADEQRLVFKLWFYSIFFSQMMPTKPLLLLVGEKGSGKTSTIRKVGVVLFGENFLQLTRCL